MSRTHEPKRRSRVFLVDDHLVFREGLTLLLQAQPDLEVCGGSSGGLDALRAIQRARPDAVLMDLSLKGMSGLELTSALRKRHPRLPILALSMHEESDYAERALRAGASGYITKEASSAKVAESLRRVLRGDVALSPTASGHLLKRAAGLGSLTGEDPVSALSDRELEVFRLIGQGLSTRRIAERLARSVKTIESHREAIKRKLGIPDASQLIQRAAAWAVRRSEG